MIRFLQAGLVILLVFGLTGLSFAETGNVGTVEQNGFNNKAFIYQYGDENIAKVWQGIFDLGKEANNNYSYVYQEGYDNKLKLYQYNDGNKFKAIQKGNHNRIDKIIRQYGNEIDRIIQDIQIGNNLTYIDYGFSQINLSITQIGNDAQIIKY